MKDSSKVKFHPVGVKPLFHASVYSQGRADIFGRQLQFLTAKLPGVFSMGDEMIL